MDIHERQQFELLLEVAVARFVERLEQRNDGPETALMRLRAHPDGDSIKLGLFVHALFEDFLLKTADGAAFVLRAAPHQQVLAPAEGTVESMLIAMAISVFRELLRLKTDEELERRAGYQPYSDPRAE